MSEALALLFFLLVAHAVCDYPLQGDFLAKAKNHKAPIPGIDWWIALSMHSLMHAGAVAWLTHSLVLGLCEFGFHCWIDWMKCDGRTSFHTDQAMHIVCKIGWVVVVGVAASPATPS